MAIKTYKKSDSTQLSANFKAREFDCNGRGCCSATPIDDQLVAYLQKIRDHFGKKVVIAAGYRCEKHNAQVPNAAKKSKHILGMAADIKVEGVAPAEVAKYAESLGVKGIGLYETEKDGYFVHIDTRTEKSFWYGHALEKRTTFGGAPEEKKGGFTLEMRNLKNGCKGEDVRALQILLMGRGYSCGNSGADGVFGNDTHSALCAYQRAKGLSIDGIAGRNTMGSLLGV